MKLVESTRIENCQQSFSCLNSSNRYSIATIEMGSELVGANPPYVQFEKKTLLVIVTQGMITLDWMKGIIYV